MRCSEDLAHRRGIESGNSVTSLGDEDQLGLSYRLHHRNLRTNMRSTRLFELFAAVSLFRLTAWFHIHLLVSI